MYHEQYVVRDSAKSATGKDKTTYVVVPKHGDQHLSDRTTTTSSADGNPAFEDESGTVEIGVPKFHEIILIFWYIMFCLEENT